MPCIAVIEIPDLGERILAKTIEQLQGIVGASLPP
jgi:hypothetical protein